GRSRGAAGTAGRKLPWDLPAVAHFAVHERAVEPEWRLGAVWQPGAPAGTGDAQVGVGIEHVVAAQGEGPVGEAVAEGQVQGPLRAVGLVAAGVGGAAISGELAPAGGGGVNREVARGPDPVGEQLVGRGAAGDAALL